MVCNTVYCRKMDTLVVFHTLATEHDIALVRWLATVHGVTHAQFRPTSNVTLCKKCRCMWLKGQKPGLERSLKRLRRLFVLTDRYTNYDLTDLICIQADFPESF